MTIEIYNIKYTLVTEDDLEKLRQWRNSEYVRSKMLYQKTITPEAQHAWYNNLDKTKNFYFIISSGGVELGMSNIKNINYENKTTEPGIFFIDEKFSNGEFSINCALIMIEISLYFFGAKELHSMAMKDNKPGFDFNTTLGFLPTQDHADYVDFTLTRENGLKTTQRIRKAFAKLYKASPDEKLKISIGNDPFLQQVYNNLADKENIALC